MKFTISYYNVWTDIEFFPALCVFSVRYQQPAWPSRAHRPSTESAGRQEGRRWLWATLKAECGSTTPERYGSPSCAVKYNPDPKTVRTLCKEWINSVIVGSSFLTWTQFIFNVLPHRLDLMQHVSNESEQGWQKTGQVITGDNRW